MKFIAALVFTILISIASVVIRISNDKEEK